jgi:C-terminal processing protease CtpA/Prc
MNTKRWSIFGCLTGFAVTLVLALVPAVGAWAEAEDDPAAPRARGPKVSAALTLKEEPAEPAPARNVFYLNDGGDTRANQSLQGSLENQLRELSQLQQYLVSVRDPADATLGATLEPVAEPIRAQLELPADQGVMVAALAGDGPAARAGLEEKDILLTLGDRPLAKADDLSEQLKVAGKSPLTLKLLRRGKPVTLRVQPAYRVTLEAADKEPANDYYIGVMLNPVDDALRAHLELPEGQGQIATQVVGGSPAAKAGVKTHDILLEMGGKPIDSPETLIAQVQASKGKATPLKLLRAGKPLTIEITPELRASGDNPHRAALRLWSLGHQAHPELYHAMPNNPEVMTPMGLRWYSHNVAPDSLDRRLDALDNELKALRKTVDEIRDSLKKEK